MAAMQKQKRHESHSFCRRRHPRALWMACWCLLVVVACFGWGRAMFQLAFMTRMSSDDTTTNISGAANKDEAVTLRYQQQQQQQQHNDASLQQQQQPPSLLQAQLLLKAKAKVVATIHDFKKPEILLSSPQRGTTVTADVRGNLGPIDVVLVDGSGDWIKDRWQAASDMHGTAIKGNHWVRLHFSSSSTPTTPTGNTNDSAPAPPPPLRLGQITRLVLDWETAYADDYRIDALYRNATVATWYDHAILKDRNRVTSRSFGQSPGVKEKLPLHVIHEISCLSPSPSTSLDSKQQQQQQQQQEWVDELLLTIRKPFHGGWGVSLWKIEVYGYDHDNNNDNHNAAAAAAAAASDQTTAIA